MSFLPLVLRTFGKQVLLARNRLRGSNELLSFVLLSSSTSFLPVLPFPTLHSSLFLIQTTFTFTLPHLLPWKINTCKETSRVILLCKKEMVRSVDKHLQRTAEIGTRTMLNWHVKVFTQLLEKVNIKLLGKGKSICPREGYRE